MKDANFISRGLLLILVVAALVSCSKSNHDCPGNAQKQFNLSDFKRVKAGEAFKLNIVKGERYSVTANGCSNDLADLDLIVAGDDELEIKYKQFRNKRERVDFTITLPLLKSVNFSGVTAGNISGFQGHSSVIRFILSGESTADVSGAGINMNFSLSGNSKLKLAGMTDNLYGNISGNGELYSYDLHTKEADVEVDGNGKAYIMPWDILYASVAGNGRVYYKLGPRTYLQVSGNGKVIQE